MPFSQRVPAGVLYSKTQMTEGKPFFRLSAPAEEGSSYHPHLSPITAAASADPVILFYSTHHASKFLPKVPHL